MHGRAASAIGRGVSGDASYEGDTRNYGGYFTASGDRGIGVQGMGLATGDVVNYGGVFTTNGNQGIGVYGQSDGTQAVGVAGSVSGAEAKAVHGYASNTDNVLNYGGYFQAMGTRGRGIYAVGGSQGYAAELHGNVILRSWSSGATIMELGEGLDYAEGFDVSDANEIEPGTVLIIDPDNPGSLTISDQDYDTRVAGIVAGAQGQGSGVRLGVDQFDYDVALAGRVYCNVDATDAAVEPGDLLTTSATPGYAMKATDYGRAQGAILGKAMERLERGEKGQILVLVTHLSLNSRALWWNWLVRQNEILVDGNRQLEQCQDVVL